MATTSVPTKPLSIELDIGGRAIYHHRPRPYPALAFPALTSLASGTFVDIDWDLFQRLIDNITDDNKHIEPVLGYLYDQLTGQKPLHTCDRDHICHVDAHGTMFMATEETLCRAPYFHHCLREMDHHPDRSIPLQVPCSPAAFRRILAYLRNPMTCTDPNTLRGALYFGPLSLATTCEMPKQPVGDVVHDDVHDIADQSDIGYHEWYPVCADRTVTYTLRVRTGNRLRDLVLLAIPDTLLQVDRVIITIDEHIFTDVSGHVMDAMQRTLCCPLQTSRTNSVSLLMPVNLQPYRSMLSLNDNLSTITIVILLNSANADTWSSTTCLSQAYTIFRNVYNDNSKWHFGKEMTRTASEASTITISPSWITTETAAIGAVFVPVYHRWALSKMGLNDRFFITPAASDYINKRHLSKDNIITMPLKRPMTGDETITIQVPCAGTIYFYCVGVTSDLLSHQH